MKYMTRIVEGNSEFIGTTGRQIPALTSLMHDFGTAVANLITNMLLHSAQSLIVEFQFDCKIRYLEMNTATDPAGSTCPQGPSLIC
jgi:hypothetical protein